MIVADKPEAISSFQALQLFFFLTNNNAQFGSSSFWSQTYNENWKTWDSLGFKIILEKS